MRYLLELQRRQGRNSWCPHSPQRSCYNCLSCFVCWVTEHNWRGPALAATPFSLCTASCIFHNDHSCEPLDYWPFPNKSQSFLSSLWLEPQQDSYVYQQENGKSNVAWLQNWITKGIPFHLALSPSQDTRSWKQPPCCGGSSWPTWRDKVRGSEAPSPAPTVRTVRGWALSGFNSPHLWATPVHAQWSWEWALAGNRLNFWFCLNKKKHFIILTHYVELSNWNTDFGWKAHRNEFHLKQNRPYVLLSLLPKCKQK